MVARSIPKQLLGTLVAVLVGWAVTLVLLESTYLIDAFRQRHALDVGLVFGSTIATSWFMAYFIIPVWLFALIPLYLFVPSSSPLWHWPICTACGAAAGFLIMTGVFLAYARDGSWSYGAWQFCGIAALVGGATCLTGSITRRVFRPNHLTNR
jgi:uncharacterized BrkB/YihY/UPF0761 family membrane protein